MAILRGEDSLVVLPTGGGKSLCFQAPALVLDGMAIVVSPLISLMKDQVDTLRELGVPAGKLHSGQYPDEARQVRDDIRAGILKMLYVSPERLLLEGFEGIARGARISFLAIDEAHCISEWGHDFRPEYRQLRGFRESHPEANMHAYTATATPRVADDIARQLGLRNARRIIGSFDRPNLFYRVEDRVRVIDQIVEIANRHKGESGIVYCISRKDTESISADLCARGVTALPYHAGLDDRTRVKNQELFIRDKVPVIVATIAFGMGIDKPDVRFVVHAAMPKSLENYQQESGRAGRDGLAAECVLLASGQDVMKWQFIIRDQPPEQQRVVQDKFRAVEEYANSMSCRRALLLDYFGEKYPDESCSGCDICSGEVVPHEDSLVTAQKILSCVVRLKEAHGAAYTSKVLTGSKEKKIMELGHHELSTFGLLAEYDKRTVKNWILQLLAQGCLDKGESYLEAPLRVTGHGWKVIRGQAEPALVHHEATRGRSQDSGWAGVNRELFEELRGLRGKLAQEKGVPPYVIFGDRTLRELARVRPTTKYGMKRIHGIGDVKMNQYGEVFLGVVRKFCDAHPDVKTDEFVEAGEITPKVQGGKVPNAVRTEAMAMLRKGMTIEGVAKRTGRTPKTIEGYLSDLVIQDGIKSPDRWVAAELAKQIEEAADKFPDTNRLKPVFEELGGEVPYWQIRVVLNCRSNRNSRAAG